MDALKPTFNCSFEDIPAIGRFVLASALRDRDHLATKSAKYKATNPFLTDYDTALQAVDALVNPAAFTAQHKKLTEELETGAKEIRPLLNDLDIRLADAADLPATGPQLTVRPADFGLKALRTAITTTDAEAIARTGKDVLDNLAANAAALALVEFPAADITELQRLIGSIGTANVAQNQLISDRDARVQANLAVLNGFYDTYLARVIADGKKAYKETDAAKTHDYTFARLKARVAAVRPARARKPAPPSAA